MLAGTMIICIKLVDLLLARRKGLALSIITLATANVGLVFALAYALTSNLASFRAPPHGWFGTATTWGYALEEAACAQPWIGPAVLGYVAGVLTLLLLIEPLKRGLEDVGFVPESFRAARRRTVGL